MSTANYNRPTMNFKLLQAIKESGWAQVDLYRAANFSSQARLSRVLNNRLTPTSAEIAALSKVLKKTPQQLGFEGSK